MIDVIKKLNYKYPKTSEIIRFLIIGGLATILDLFVMSIIIYYPNRLLFQNSLINVFLNKRIASGLLVAFASCIGFICGLIFNYIFSLKFVYYGDNKKAKTKKGFLIFALLSACGLVIETVGVYLGYEIFKFNEWIIKIILIFVVLIFNYFTRKKFLFSEDNSKSKVDNNTNLVALNENEKIKIEKFLFVVLFAIYFIISCVSIFYINSTDWGYIFGVDSPRVFSDWTDFKASHYRTKVHPLYVLLIYPIVNLFVILGANPVIAVVIFLCLIATLNVYLLYKTLLKISKNKCSLVAVVLTIIYAFSFTQVENLMAIESFIVSTFSVLLFWYYFVLKFGNNVKNKKDYIYLTLLGVLSFSMLLTNFIHFIIGLSFLILFNKKKKGKEFFKDLIPFVVILFITICISFVLTLIQEMIFTSSSNAFKYVLSMFKDIIMGTKNSEEFSYINFNITGNNFLNILLFFFGISFSGGEIGVGDKGLLTIEANLFTYSTIILVIALLVISIYSIIKNKKYFAVPVSLAFLYEIIIHLFYGNDELMLYIIQPTFILLILLSMGLSDIDFKNKKTCWIKYVLLGLMLLSFCSSFVSAIILLFKIYSKYGFSHLYLFGENKRFIAFIVLVTLVYLFVNYVLRKTQKINISSNIKKLNYKSLLFALLFSFSIILSTYVVPVQNYYTEEHNYISSSVIKIENFDKVLLGMGQRKKYVLEASGDKSCFYHYDLSSKQKNMIFEDLYDVTYDAENYIISAKTNNKYINIFENSSGLHIKSGYSLETLDDTKINIPSFDGYSHQRNLKILFHEVMVNVLPNGFTPNFLTYGNFWYRDGAIVSMVLKETNNLDQMKLNVDPTKIYDGARGGVDEADNLGELLYMLSLMEEKDWDTINAVLDEAHRIKKGDCIYGYTDGGDLYVYQTTWLKYGMDSLGIDSSEYVVEGKADSYSNMCWWYKRDVPENYPYDAENMEKILFDPSKMYYPYLDIARLHYYQVKIDIPHLLMYPISFELQDWGLNGKVAHCSPHSWSASELFLYLLDYDKF